MTAVERLLTAARGEIGYLEKSSNSQLDHPTANAGRKDWNKYAAWLDGLGDVYNGKKNGYAWCDVFVDWCFLHTFGRDVGMAMTGQASRGLGAGCTYSVRYYKDMGRFFTGDPRPGDQIFFTRDGGASMYHTGIVERVEGGRVHTIEGNTSSGPGVEPNGGGVFPKSYPLGSKYIGGYGRPDWSNVKEDEPMTQEQFNRMMDVYLAERCKREPDPSWGSEARAWALETGLIAGGDGGSPMWEGLPTRNQLVVVLFKFWSMVKELVRG